MRPLRDVDGAARLQSGRETFTKNVKVSRPLSADWSLIPANVPAGVTALLQRCLEEDPRRRRRDIGDVLVNLDEALHVDGSAQPRRALGRWLLPAAGALLLAAVAATFVQMGRSRDLPASSSDARLSLLLPPGMTFPEQDNQMACRPTARLASTSPHRLDRRPGFCCESSVRDRTGDWRRAGRA